MIQIRISDEAFNDLDDAYWFYELQESGLGTYFITSLRTETDGLKFTAGIHRKDYHDYHRLICKTFPYAIYYTTENNEVVVWAVIDYRCDPDWIQNHLAK